MSDDVLQKAIDGDHRAFTTLLIAHHQVICKAVSRVIGGGHEDFEDVVSEFHLSLWSNDRKPLRAWRADRGSSVGSWLYLLARNAAFDYMRRSKRKPKITTDTIPEIPDSFTPETATAILEGREWLKRAVRTERCDYRLLFQLLLVERLPTLEVAEALGISTARVAQMKHRLLQRLSSIAEDTLP